MKAQRWFQMFTGLLVLVVLVAAASGAVADILWDQLTGTAGPDFFASQDFEAARDANDCWAADDFVVGGSGWVIESCDWSAYLSFGFAQVYQVNFYIWPDRGDGFADFDNPIHTESGLEGEVLSYGDIHYDFATPVTLDPGHYFFGVQVEMDFESWGEHFWYVTTKAQQGDIFAIINPGDGFSMGDDWWNPADPVEYDASFRLSGTLLEIPLAPYVVLAEEGVWLQAGCWIASGDVGANTESNNAFFDDLEVAVGLFTRFEDPESRLMGDSIALGLGSQVYDVYYNDLSGRGNVLGEQHTPIELPLVPALPEVPEVTPGTTDVSVPWGETAVLDQGSYGDLASAGGGTVVFTGGEYDFESWLVGPSMNLCFEAPSVVRIAGRIYTGPLTYLGPAESADLGAPDIVLYVGGVNGGSEDDPLGTPAAARFGLANTLIANVCVPSGTLRIGSCTKAEGAFLGRWVEAGLCAELEHSSAW
jgi:hypothetical protein